MSSCAVSDHLKGLHEQQKTSFREEKQKELTDDTSTRAPVTVRAVNIASGCKVMENES